MREARSDREHSSHGSVNTEMGQGRNVNGREDDWVPTPNAAQNGTSAAPKRLEVPEALSMAKLLALDAAPSTMIIRSLIPSPGASLLVGAPKSGKTILAAQMAFAIARGAPLFGR